MFSNRKKSRCTFQALLSTVTDYFIGVELIAGRYIEKWVSKEVVKLNPKNTQKREWTGGNEIVSSEVKITKCGLLVVTYSPLELE